MSEFFIGMEVDWTHGHSHHRVGKIIEITKEKVKLRGSTKDYWVTKKTLIKNINKPYPIGHSIFAPVFHS